jgi:uncharacterized membrane protein YgdD (TMEM256/DUF423 family)
MISPLEKSLLIVGSLVGFATVAIGAFGAHALKERLSLEMMAIFEVGVRYQMYHAFAIFIAVWISTLSGGATLAIISGWLFFSGILVFSGSLYTLALSNIRAFGAITPIGGLLMLAGWITLLIGIIRIK